MVVHNFHILRPLVPQKANAELVVDPDAVLAGPITTQSLKPVTRGHSKVTDHTRPVELLQLTPRHTRNIGKARDRYAIEELFSIGALERLDRHKHIVTRRVTMVKHRRPDDELTIGTHVVTVTKSPKNKIECTLETRDVPMTTNTKPRRIAKRNLYAELTEGVSALARTRKTMQGSLQKKHLGGPLRAELYSSAREREFDSAEAVLAEAMAAKKPAQPIPSRSRKSRA